MQVMVAVAILGVVIAGTTSFMDTSNRDAKSLQQKLEILQSTQDIMRELSDPAICACNFDPTINIGNAAALRFDSTNPSSFIQLPQLFATCVGGVPGMPIFIAGQRIPGSQSQLTVESIQLKNFVATGTGRFRGNLEIEFNKDSLVMGRKPASVNLSVMADVSNPAQARITSCTSGRDVAGGGTGSATMCPESPMPWGIAGQLTIPAAPVGTFFVLTGTGNAGLTAREPGCGSTYAFCDYIIQNPPTVAWTTPSSAPCPSTSDGP